VRRHLLLILGLTLATAGPAGARTFTRTPIAPELDVDVLTGDVAHAKLGRQLFSDPWATETIAHTDVYDRFPYVESRQFQLVTDPRWNRLVYGERGRGLAAWDGRGTTTGALMHPHGLAVDDADRVYIADTGNDRIVVLQATTTLGDMTLAPLYTIEGLSGPYDVAWSDGGTPFQDGDDVLYVADTGRNQVVAFALAGGAARRVAALGALGSGTGRFGGPMAVAVGRTERGCTPDLYVADAHNRRLVHLTFDGHALRWGSETRVAADLVTALDTDNWGNVYAAAPREAAVRKYNPDLAEVAQLRDALAGPRGFSLPFETVRDHRDGTVTRVGRPLALSVDAWNANTGIGMWALGLDVTGLAAHGGAAPAAEFTLTDRARVALEVLDATSGRVLARKDAGTLAAGPHTVPLDASTLGGGDLMVRVNAASTYANGASESAQTTFRLDGAAVTLPGRAALIGNAPNPASPSTRILFVLPAGGTGTVALSVYDAGGRRVRAFAPRFAPGLNEIAWDGTDDQGRAVRAGVYFYRLEAGAIRDTRRLVLVR
jgi:hypothetical protein